MKADHRKELHTNLLADRMGRLVQGVKSGRGPKSAIVWVIVGIALVTLIGWFVANQAGARTGAAWIAFHNAGTNETAPAALKVIGETHSGTLAARTARFQRARLLLREGLDAIYANVGSLPSLGAHDQAQEGSVRNLEEARKLFGALIPECSESPILEQEAILSAAKAEEALVGVPKQDDPLEGRGSLDEASSLYRRLANKYETTELGKEAAVRWKEIENNRAQMDQFYLEFRAAGTKRTPFKDPFSPQQPFNP